MTATALAYNLAFEPELDVLEDLRPTPRPQLRVIQGTGQGTGHGAVQALGPRTVVQPRSIEVYRRRRFAALAVVVVAALLVLQLAGVSLASLTNSAVALPAVAEEAPVVHVVMPGDTYGAIAASLGAEYPLVAADQIQIDNGGGELVVGQRILVPEATLALGPTS